MKKYIIVIDEGTTGTRAILFDRQFQMVSQHYQELQLCTDSTGMVEESAVEIFDKSVECCKLAMQKAGAEATDIEAIAITNQRRTVTVWDNDGNPVHNAITWQDTRVMEQVPQIKADGWTPEKLGPKVGQITPNQNVTLMHWMRKKYPEVKRLMDRGEGYMGAIDTWLVWKLTGGKTYALSGSNSSIHGGHDVTTGELFQEYLDYLDVSDRYVPALYNDSDFYGVTEKSIFGVEIPITGVIADQHSSLFSQRITKVGMAKCTNGTGSFMDVNIGDKIVPGWDGFGCNVAWRLNGVNTFLLEGYTPSTGSALRWVRDGLKCFGDYDEVADMVASVPDSGGLIFVPALSGLKAPHLDPKAGGLMIGLSQDTNQAHIVRATLEGIAFMIADIMNGFRNDMKVAVDLLRIDGGLTNSKFFCQTVADFTKTKVERIKVKEATALGAAEMAGMQVGWWTEKDFDELIQNPDVYMPVDHGEVFEKQYHMWHKAYNRCLDWRE